MRVLVITASLNQKSGWGRYGAAVINELIRQGHVVSVLSEDAPLETSYPVGRISPLRSRIPLFSLVANALRTRRAARAAEVVHALDGWPYGVYGFAAVLGTRKALVVNGVGTYAVAPLYAWGSSWLMRKAYTRANAIPCISSHTAKKIREAGVKDANVCTVHMGAPILPSLTDEEMQTRVREAGVPSGRFPIMLTVGAIKERKGQFDTLRAVGILKMRYPDILYIAVGSGNHVEYIRSMNEYAKEHDLVDNLRIFTNVDDKTLAALYAGCTVFALNSNSDPGSRHFEGFGLVVLEAAGYGKPAVGSKDSGVEDTIDEGKSGFTTRQHDPEDIAAKIELILEEYPSFSSNAKMWHSKFTWQKTVEEYVRAYRG